MTVWFKAAFSFSLARGHETQRSSEDVV